MFGVARSDKVASFRLHSAVMLLALAAARRSPAFLRWLPYQIDQVDQEWPAQVN